MSSIRIPAVDLHKSLIMVLMHKLLLRVDVQCRGCVCLLTPSGSALRLIEFCVLMLFQRANGDKLTDSNCSQQMRCAGGGGVTKVLHVGCVSVNLCLGTPCHVGTSATVKGRVEGVCANLDVCVCVHCA